MFGFRVFHGECIFVTVSPNRRHSSLLLKLRRSRSADPLLGKWNDKDPGREYEQRRCGSVSAPPIFVDADVCDGESGTDTATLTLDLPVFLTRLSMNADNPLSSVHHFLVVMYIIVPAVFGLRMCFQCPRCNRDEHDPSTDHQWRGCQDCCGTNTKPIGGYGGLAEAMAFAVEMQGDSTPHAHGFVALCNMYQRDTLEDVAGKIRGRCLNMDAREIVERVVRFTEHMEQQDD